MHPPHDDDESRCQVDPEGSTCANPVTEGRLTLDGKLPAVFLSTTTLEFELSPQKDVYLIRSLGSTSRLR